METRNRTGASRAALLELRRERELIEQGHRFLDEKRMQLARELLRRIESYEQLLEALHNRHAKGRDALRQAVIDYGLADIQVYPALASAGADWDVSQKWFLGLSLPEAEMIWRTDGLEEEPAIKRPGVEEAAGRYAEVTEVAAAGAAMLTAMFRLEAEYKRTERSVRALENVVMPEIRQEEKVTEEALAEIEQEEAVRVRLFGKGR